MGMRYNKCGVCCGRGGVHSGPPVIPQLTANSLWMDVLQSSPTCQSELPFIKGINAQLALALALTQTMDRPMQQCNTVFWIVWDLVHLTPCLGVEPCTYLYSVDKSVDTGPAVSLTQGSALARIYLDLCKRIKAAHSSQDAYGKHKA